MGQTHVNIGARGDPASPRHSIWLRQATVLQSAYQGPLDPDVAFSFWASPITQDIILDASASRLPVLHDIHVTTGLAIHNGTHEGWKGYVYDLKELFTRLPSGYLTKPFAIRYGDAVTRAPYPVLSKSRVIGDTNAILLPINYKRHFGTAFDRIVQEDSPDDFLFEDKIPKVFWRGATTDHGWDPEICAPENHRRSLIDRWGSCNDPRLDLGFSALVQEAAQQALSPDGSHWARYKKEPKYLADQLRYRYLLAIEGNDVASGLKWMLASQSVILMPPPRRETWALESQLQAWVHYIPLLPDFSDLLEKVEFCEAQLHICQSVSRHATEYMRQIDKNRSYNHGAATLRAYLDLVKDEAAEDSVKTT